MQTSYRGFTLIEMMVTVTLLAIIVALAAPSFTRTIENARLSAQTNDFVTAVNTARAEAIRIGGGTWLTAKSDNFAAGWCVRTTDPCGTDDPPDLLDHPPLDPNLSLTYPALPETTSFAFNRLGALANEGDQTAIDLTPQNCSAEQMKRRIGINAIGRVSVERLDC